MRLRFLLILALLSSMGLLGCGLRTVPPIKYLPLFGKEKDVTTTSVLVHALKDRDISVRAQAIVLLGVLAKQDDKTIQKEVARLLGTALKDRDPGIRLQAVEELGRMKSEFTNKYLLAALRDPNAFVREKVMEVLAVREAQQLKELKAQLEAKMQTSMKDSSSGP